MARRELWSGCALLTLLLACDPKASDDPTNPDSHSAPDADADGYVAVELGGEDCDDTNPNIGPHAVERCDGIDNDCNGEIDGADAEDATLWFGDADDDGFGDGAVGTLACDEPEGYAAVPGDCDDLDPNVHPGATEQTFNGRDDDCDPLTYDGDMDGDGHHAPEVGGEDCDDTNAAVYPGAVEVCDDAVVNDCRTSPAKALSDCLLNGEEDLTGADITFTGEADGDWAGGQVASAGDVDGDALPDVLVSAGANDYAAPHAGRAYLLLSSGALRGRGLVPLANADRTLTGVSAYDSAGTDVAGAGDVDGDGLADLLIGARHANSEDGVAYLVLAADLLRSASTDLGLADATLTIQGVAPDGQAGHAVSSAGDTDGDGLDDILIGAHNSDGARVDEGAAYLLLGGGSLAATPGTLSLDDAELTFTGESRYDQLGGSVSAAGDIDGDGRDDAMVSAHYADSYKGTAYLLLSSGALSRAGAQTSSDADLKITGEHVDDLAGYQTASAGDIDEDGRPDLIVGAPGSQAGVAAGAAYLLLSGGALSGATGQLSLADADLKLTGENNGDSSGRAVDGAGDVDGDGRDDLLVGALHFHDGAGATYLLLNGGSLDTASGTMSLGDADARIMGRGPADLSGWSAVFAGDINMDGRSDLVIGALNALSSGVPSGDVYVLFGSMY